MHSVIEKDGIIRSIEDLSDSPFKRKLCVDIDNLIVIVLGRGVENLLSCYSDEELIGRTATIMFYNDNGTFKFPVLLKVDDIFYKGIIKR